MFLSFHSVAPMTIEVLLPDNNRQISLSKMVPRLNAVMTFDNNIILLKRGHYEELS